MALAAGQADVRDAIAALTMRRRGNKYRAVRTVVDGLTFDSKKEATYFSLLRLRERSGLIRNLERQPVFELHAPSGEVIGQYRGDMRFEELFHGRWRSITIDVKSKATRTALYRWKRRHVMAEYRVLITEV